MNFDENIIKLLNYIKDLDNTDKEKISKILEKMNHLDEYPKKRILQKIISDSLSLIEDIEIAIAKQQCDEIGHSFAEWQHVTYAVEDGITSNKFKQLEYWKRKCTRCQLVDVSSVNPQKLEKPKKK